MSNRNLHNAEHIELNKKSYQFLNIKYVLLKDFKIQKTETGQLKLMYKMELKQDKSA